MGVVHVRVPAGFYRWVTLEVVYVAFHQIAHKITRRGWRQNAIMLAVIAMGAAFGAWVGLMSYPTEPAEQAQIASLTQAMVLCGFLGAAIGAIGRAAWLESR